MTRENPYQDIEREIRKQLEIAREVKIWRSKVTPSSLSDVVCYISETSALDKIKDMLKKLPVNYFELPELTQMYVQLI